MEVDAAAAPASPAPAYRSAGDRESCPPSLLRAFVRPRRHNESRAYSRADRRVPACSAEGEEEVALYVWPSTTLYEIATMLRAASATAASGGKLHLHLVVEKGRGAGREDDVEAGGSSKDMAFIPMEGVSHDRAFKSDVRTLAEFHFTPGSYLDVQVQGLPREEEPAAAAAAAAAPEGQESAEN